MFTVIEKMNLVFKVPPSHFVLCHSKVISVKFHLIY